MTGRGFPTVNFRVDYLRPVMSTGLRIVGKARRIGRRIGIADVDVFDDRGALVAVGRASYSTPGDPQSRETSQDRTKP
jgi:uncharacterized protein (TIGR00369 family)